MIPETTKFRLYVFSTLALANASTRTFGNGTFIMIKGDYTRFKMGGGIDLSFDTPPAPTAQTFAQLPWVNTVPVFNSNTNPYAANTSATLTAAQLAQQYITSTSAAAVALLGPTATLLATQLGAIAGTRFTFTIDNSAGANPVTFTPGSGFTKTGVGSFIVPTGGTTQFEVNFTSPTAATIKSYAVNAAADVVAITDNTTGVSGLPTLAVVTNPDLSAWNGSTDPTATQATAINAAITSLKNAVAALAAENNALLTALKNAGLMV